MVYYITWFFSRFLSYIFFPFKIYGKKNIPAEGNFIIASNHISNLDPVIIPLCFTRRMNFMAKDSLFRVFFLGSFLKQLGAYPIKRQASDIGAIKETLRRLRKGRPVLIFPQGTRIPERQRDKVQPGIGFVAAKSGLPVLPLYIEGSNDVMPPRSKGLKRSPVKVVFGKVQNYSPHSSYQDIADQVMDSIYSLA